ncbi:MAG: hypothetical protein K9K66_11665 [Desulfarculaceae bacterium]|nr:hypothetical protein [Desulfarculaceae bacterium]MCF8071491.1 hypothetical protein [Desulfarculaceae bacterium]MCF8102306.1 hypothetical protein [Desulfarculaceae bacterium]MCF8114770.1 hypothetical protein [Desulfarculaceae bacterium]
MAEQGTDSGTPNFHHGFFHLIGCGPGGPRTATLQALETIEAMDVILAPARQARLFKDYIGAAEVAFDPWEGFWDFKGKHFATLSPEELPLFRKNRQAKFQEHLEQVKGMLGQGQDVGLLEFGNPCLFGPGHTYAEQLKPQEVIIIPGMGADAAALAALKTSILPAHEARFLLQAAPFVLTGHGLQPDMSVAEPDQAARELLKLLAGQEHSAIFYMALADAPHLFQVLSDYLAPELPCAVVYWAGDPERQRVLRGTLAEMPALLQEDPERFMGLLLMGRFLEGHPFSAAHGNSPAMRPSP